jgi:hypothetical protein
MNYRKLRVWEEVYKPKEIFYPEGKEDEQVSI